MTRYARALGSKASNARVPADPTPWSDMSPAKVDHVTVEDFEDIKNSSPPKKIGRRTPGKKVVEMKANSPVTPKLLRSSKAITVPSLETSNLNKSANKRISAVTKPSSVKFTSPKIIELQGTPKVRVSELSPLQTRSARKKREAETAAQNKKSSPAKQLTPKQTSVVKKLNDSKNIHPKFNDDSDDVLAPPKKVSLRSLKISSDDEQNEDDLDWSGDSGESGSDEEDEDDFDEEDEDDFDEEDEGDDDENENSSEEDMEDNFDDADIDEEDDEIDDCGTKKLVCKFFDDEAEESYGFGFEDENDEFEFEEESDDDNIDDCEADDNISGVKRKPNAVKSRTNLTTQQKANIGTKKILQADGKNSLLTASVEGVIKSPLQSKKVSLDTSVTKQIRDVSKGSSTELLNGVGGSPVKKVTVSKNLQTPNRPSPSPKSTKLSKTMIETPKKESSDKETSNTKQALLAKPSTNLELSDGTKASPSSVTPKQLLTYTSSPTKNNVDDTSAKQVTEEKSEVVINDCDGNDSVKSPAKRNSLSKQGGKMKPVDTSFAKELVKSSDKSIKGDSNVAPASPAIKTPSGATRQEIIKKTPASLKKNAASPKVSSGTINFRSAENDRTSVMQEGNVKTENCESTFPKNSPAKSSGKPVNTKLETVEVSVKVPVKHGRKSTGSLTVLKSGTPNVNSVKSAGKKKEKKEEKTTDATTCATSGESIDMSCTNIVSPLKGFQKKEDNVKNLKEACQTPIKESFKLDVEPMNSTVNGDKSMPIIKASLVNSKHVEGNTEKGGGVIPQVENGTQNATIATTELAVARKILRAQKRKAKRAQKRAQKALAVKATSDGDKQTVVEIANNQLKKEKNKSSEKRRIAEQDKRLESDVSKPKMAKVTNNMPINTVPAHIQPNEKKNEEFETPQIAKRNKKSKKNKSLKNVSACNENEIQDSNPAFLVSGGQECKDNSVNPKVGKSVEKKSTLNNQQNKKAKQFAESRNDAVEASKMVNSSGRNKQPKGGVIDIKASSVQNKAMGNPGKVNPQKIIQEDEAQMHQVQEGKFEKKGEFQKKSKKSTVEVQAVLNKNREEHVNQTKVRQCFRCRETGHLASSCPKGGPQARKCFKCGEENHHVKDCPQKGESFKFADCYICHQQGHLAKSCPQNENGLYVNGGGCRVCGDKQHLAKDCPAKNKRQRHDNQNTNKQIHIGTMKRNQSADADVDVDEVPTKVKKTMKNKGVVKF